MAEQSSGTSDITPVPEESTDNRSSSKKPKTPKTTTLAADPPPTPPAPPERQPVLLHGEPELMKELGLGRGVDGTSSTPWLNKTAFQVRSVNDKTITGTEEGGTVQSYVREVTSVRSQQSTLKASIDVPKAPVTIGVDAEYSRTFTQSRKSVGNRVHNRTISFISDFDDASDWMFHKPPESSASAYDWRWPYPETDIKPEGTEDGGKEDAGVKPKSPPPLELVQFGLTFEQRLCKWILDEVSKPKGQHIDSSGTAAHGTGAVASASAGEDAKPGDESKPDYRSTTTILDDFTKYFESFSPKQVRAMIDPHCIKFTDYFRITHYVSAIQLGAAKYEVMENDQYTRKIGGSANAAVEKIGALDFSTNLNWNWKVSESRASQIGVLRSDKVRGMVVQRDEEAVIGAMIRPLSSLIRHPLLRESLQRALKCYMDNVQDDREGPFLISCNDDQVYLQVNDHFQVVGVENHKQASSFYLVPTYDSTHPREFTLTYLSEKRFRDIDPVPRFLSLSTNRCGRNEGPLTMRLDVNEHNSRLTLQSRQDTHYHPVEITPWVTGREAYYISGVHRLFRKTGYICLKRRAGRFITASVPSTEYHSEAHRCYMVFRLIRPELFQGGRFKDGEATGIGSDDEDDGEKTIRSAQMAVPMPLPPRGRTSGDDPLMSGTPGIQARQVEMKKVDT